MVYKNFKLTSIAASQKTKTKKKKKKKKTEKKNNKKKQKTKPIGTTTRFRKATALMSSKVKYQNICANSLISHIFSSPGRSPGRPIVLPPALAAASALTKNVKVFFLCDGQGDVRRAILSL